MEDNSIVFDVMMPNFKTIDGVTRVSELLVMMRDEKLMQL